MTEQMYDDHDTQPIKLPRLGRDSLEPVVNPPEWSPESAQQNQTRMREFEVLDPKNPDSLRHFELLRVDDVLNIPVAAHDETGNRIPNAFEMREYRVAGTSSVEGKMMATIVDARGIEDMIPADVFAKPPQGWSRELDPSRSLEAAIAQQLIDLDGVDIHSPDVQLIERDEFAELEERIR